MKREVIIDTETTGLETKLGHRIIEIGCIELINREVTDNNFHVYINPEREIDAGALQVHGISASFLQDKPKFAEICQEFLTFIKDATLVIHNAPFDVGFINYELALLKAKKHKPIDKYLKVIDTLAMARRRFPGQRNSLDALCKRYEVDNSKRDLHGALVDADLLAQVYLAMTGGQTSMFVGDNELDDKEKNQPLAMGRYDYKIIYADATETDAHQAYLQALTEKSGQPALWQKLVQEDDRN
ncbi:MAG: DNA polymerase III subunit epsilon [Pseudomonadota bacterium]